MWWPNLRAAPEPRPPDAASLPGSRPVNRDENLPEAQNDSLLRALDAGETAADVSANLAAYGDPSQPLAAALVPAIAAFIQGR